MNPEKFTNYIRLRNWKRNAELIDFSKIPEEIEVRIIDIFNTTEPQDSISMKYFIENNIQELIDEFA